MIQLAINLLNRNNLHKIQLEILFLLEYSRCFTTQQNKEVHIVIKIKHTSIKAAPHQE